MYEFVSQSVVRCALVGRTARARRPSIRDSRCAAPRAADRTLHAESAVEMSGSSRRSELPGQSPINSWRGALHPADAIRWGVARRLAGPLIER